MPRRHDVAGLLVGDGIENPLNAKAMLDAGSMFGVPVSFRDRADLRINWDAERGGAMLSFVTLDQLVGQHRPALLAVENTPRSDAIFGRSLADHSTVVVGNERRGIGRDLLAAARNVVHIPMVGHRSNTLNVAAAAAAALYFLRPGHHGAGHASRRPERRRPTLCLMAPMDHVEAGSALRSAAGLGWRSVHLLDRHRVWFGTPRPMRTEGRAAARSHRQDLRVIRVQDDPSDRSFRDVFVIATSLDGPSLTSAHLAAGPNSLVVLPDERGVDLAAEDWERLGSRVRFVNLDLPKSRFAYRYRLTATIAMVEISRQIGIGARTTRTDRAGGLRYDSAIDLSTADDGVISWEELLSY